MRAFPTALIAAALLASPVFAQSMANMPGMDHGPQSTKTGTGTGVITAIGSKTGTLTIKHGPIPAIGWPAMTMTFKATPSALLRGLRVGQTVTFNAKARGMNAEVIAVHPH